MKSRNERAVGARRWRRGAAAAALTVGLAVPLTAPATAATAAPAEVQSRPAGTYLALGDSVAFGYRPPAVTPPAAYQDARNFRSYANLTAGATRLRLVNASCPGETSGSMLNTQAPDVGCRLYRSVYPLHVSYAGTQMNYAVRFLRTSADTRLVSVSLGANDLLLCFRVAGCDVAAAIRQAGANLDQALYRIRHDGRYRGPIVVVIYYLPAGYPRPVLTGLNAALVAAARRHGGRVANGLAAFDWIAGDRDNCQAGLLIQLPVTGGCDIHPTAAGHLVLAAAVTGAYLRHPAMPARRVPAAA